MAAASLGRWFTTQPLPVRIAGIALAVWLVMLCVLPDPRPLGAPEWTVQLAQRLTGIAEPRARFVATTLLRGAGVGLIGVLLAVALSGWKSRAAVPAILVGAPLLALVAKWINFGGLPIWPQLLFILLVAFLGGLAALADESRSLAVGLSKEEMDSTPGGSGFSFVDMAANCAGIRLAAAATRTERAAHTMQARIRRGVEVSDLLPSLRGLPEGITRDQLQADYGGLGGAETRRLLGEIDRRISELPLYR